jgi:outer membrane protein assembly factor BamB/tetratricopeptide (TPR) repeat protein
MAFEGDLTNLGLADIFQTLAMNRQTGTLVVKNGDTERRFHFSDHGVSLLSSRSARRFRLGNLLVGMGKLSDGDLRVAVAKQERNKDAKLGDILIQTDLVKKSDIDEACRYQSAEEIYESFSWRSGKFQFLEGANAGPQGGPGPFAEIYFECTDVVMEAARRSDEFSMTLQKIGDTGEFYARCGPETLSPEELGRPAVGLYGALDGTMDVAQVFEDFYLSAFDTSQAFLLLRDKGHIRAMGADDLVAAAQPFLDKRDHARAARMLSRAVQKKPDDPDLLLRLAGVQTDAGQRKEAAASFVALGKLYRARQQPVEAVDALRKAVELDSRGEAAYEMLMETYASLEQFDKSEEACREAARLLSDDRNFEGSLRLLDRGLAGVPQSTSLRIQRANCLLALGRKDEGMHEMVGVAKVLEERRDNSGTLLGVYRKLAQLDSQNAEYRDKVEWLVAGEKRREQRKRLARGGMVAAGLGLLVAGWMVRPKTASEKVVLADAALAENTTAGEGRAEELAKAVLSGAEAGSDLEMSAKRILAAVEQRRAAPRRRAEAAALRQSILADQLQPALALAEQKKYAEAIRAALPALDRIVGAEAAALKGTPELDEVNRAVQGEVRKIGKAADDGVRGEWKLVQAGLLAVEGLDLEKADDEKLRLALEASALALESPRRADWPAVVAAIGELTNRAVAIEGVSVPELRRTLSDMDAALVALRDRHDMARAASRKREVRAHYSRTLQEVDEAKLAGEIDRALAACDRFLADCDALRKEKPEKCFLPVVDAVLNKAGLDRDVARTREKYATIRKGLDAAKTAEARGDLQTAFDLLVKTIGGAPDVDFKRLARLPLRILSRPAGARLTVQVEGASTEVDAGTAPRVIAYAYQGRTVIRAELPGFEPAVIERRGIEADKLAEVVLDLQRKHRWRRQAGASVEGRPALAGSLVLVGTRAGLLRGLDAATGDERFQVQTGHLSGISGGVLASGDLAWFGGNDREAFAVDTAKGEIRWRKKTPAGIPHEPLLAAGRVIFADADGRLLSFDPASGAEGWTRELGSRITSGIHAAGGLVLAGLADGRLVAVDAATGAEKWSHPLGGPASSRITDGPAGTVLVAVDGGTSTSTVACVEAATGKRRWAAPVTAPVRGRIVSRADGIRAVTSDGKVVRFGTDGTPAGEPASLGVAVEGGMAHHGGHLYICAVGGRLLAFDMDAGAVAWALADLGDLRGEPAVAPGGLVVAASDRNGIVVMLEP